MSGNRGFRRTTRTPGGYKNEPSGRIHMYDKIYVGFVKENRDSINMGRLKVWIPELSPNGQDSIDEKCWYTVNYCSPFGGATRPNKLSKPNKETDAPENTQQSYGFWAVPPDLDNEVVVMFINGDPNRGIWIGSMFQQFMNHMVPAIASNKSFDSNTAGSPPPSGVNPPVEEYNKKQSDASAKNPVRPYFKPLHDGLFNEGLYVDEIRGPSTASARRKDDYDPHQPRKNWVGVQSTSGDIPPTVDADGNVLAQHTSPDGKATDPAANTTASSTSPATLSSTKPNTTPTASTNSKGTPSKLGTALLGGAQPKAGPSLAPVTVNPAATANVSVLAAQLDAAKKALDVATITKNSTQLAFEAATNEFTTVSPGRTNEQALALKAKMDAAKAAADTAYANSIIATGTVSSLQAKYSAAKDAVSRPGTPVPGSPSNSVKPTTPGAGTAAPGGKTEADSTSSQAEGDPPALVYGLISPQGNHMYIDDAGDGMIRLRTRNGAQIMINDNVGYIYMISRNGNSWMEISDDGIDMYSSQAISMRAHGDINMHADGNINQYAAGSMNHSAQGGGTASYHGGYNMLSDQLNLTSAGSVNIYSPVRVSISGPSVGIAATGDIGITAGGALGITAGGELKLVGSKIGQNSGKGVQAKVEPIQQQASGSSSGGGGSGSGSGGGSSGGGSGGGSASDASLPDPSSEGGSRISEAMKYFTDPKQGWTKEQAAGIIANLQYESGLDPNEHKGDSGRAYGIAEWHSPRQQDFYNLYGKNIKGSSYGEQLRFVQHELTHGTYKSAGTALRSARTTDAATEAIILHYERPKNPGASLGSRQAIARKIAAGTAADPKAVKSGDTATTGDTNSKTPGLSTAAQPNEPANSSGTVNGPLEANTPAPTTLNDRQLDVKQQFPACSTYTIVSRLVTHEPFEGHPVKPKAPVEGPIPSSSPVTEDGGGSGGTTTAPNSEVQIPDDGKKYCVPTNGTVNSPFGMRTLGGTTKMHNGVDIRTPVGTPVVASKDGVISVHHDNSASGGYGLYATIKHSDGMTTLYGHLSQVLVSSGQVKQGQTVALSGNSGHSTGAHLHFGISKGGTGGPWANPASAISKLKLGNGVRAGEQ